MKLTIRELATYLRLSKESVYKWINAGRLPFYIIKRGKRKDKYFDLKEIKKILGI